MRACVRMCVLTPLRCMLPGQHCVCDSCFSPTTGRLHDLRKVKALSTRCCLTGTGLPACRSLGCALEGEALALLRISHSCARWSPLLELFGHAPHLPRSSLGSQPDSRGHLWLSRTPSPKGGAEAVGVGWSGGPPRGWGTGPGASLCSWPAFFLSRCKAPGKGESEVLSLPRPPLCLPAWRPSSGVGMASPHTAGSRRGR